MKRCLVAIWSTLLYLCTLTPIQAMTMVKQVAVIGATGRLGRLAVTQLVERGIPCKILVRQETLPSPPPSLSLDTKENGETSLSSAQVAAYLASLKGVSVVHGDVGDVQALRELVKDCDACLALYGATRRSKVSDLWQNVADEDPSHAKQVNYQGVLNLLQACEAVGCRRLVRITGKGETPTNFISILINVLGSMAKAWNYQGEQALRGQNTVDYTIIRPGLMKEDGPVGNVLTLADDGGDLPVAKIRYADIASLCIDCLEYDNAKRATLTAMTCENGASTWAPLLEKVQPDRRQFPSDMLEQHYAAVRKFLFGAGALGALALAVVVKLILG